MEYNAAYHNGMYSTHSRLNIFSLATDLSRCGALTSMETNRSYVQAESVRPCLTPYMDPSMAKQSICQSRRHHSKQSDTCLMHSEYDCLGSSGTEFIDSAKQLQSTVSQESIIA